MKHSKRKPLIIAAVIIGAVFLAYFPARPHINRWLDNRERAVITYHGTIIEDKIQNLARQKGHYPASEEVALIIQNAGLISPHTGSTYTYIGQITDMQEISDSQIAYGLGEYEGSAPDNSKAYFCIGSDLPRVNEGGSSCETLTLTPQTDAMLKYLLSCETNWLGFSTGCDERLLQAQ